jgi:hypothetical protein
MARDADLTELKKAADHLADQCKDDPLIYGVGLTRLDGDWAISVMVGMEAPDDYVPQEFEGFRVLSTRSSRIVAQ